MLSAAFKVVGGAAVVATLGAISHEWKTDLKPVGDSQIVGEASVAVSTDMKSMTDTTKAAAPGVTAKVNIKGAKDGDVHPWHVHAGACGSPDAPIVGTAKEYEAIKVGSTGEGSATAKVSAQLSETGQYLVNVHKSPDDMTVVSCGQLKLAGDPTESKQ